MKKKTKIKVLTVIHLPGIITKGGTRMFIQCNSSLVKITERVQITGFQRSKRVNLSTMNVLLLGKES